MKKSLYNIFLVLFFLLIGLSANAKDLKFIQVTDFHYTNTDFSDARLRTLVKSINSTDDVDFIIFTGDNIDSANPVTLEKFLKGVRKIKVPYYFQIGNHDCFKSSGLDKAQYAKMVSKYSHKKIMSFNYVVKKDGIVFIFVDGMKDIIPAQNGYFKRDTLAWLDKTLTKYSKDPVILVQHFPILSRKKNEPSHHDLYRVDEYKQIINKYDNIIAIISGHYHYNKEEEINGVRHIVTSRASGDMPQYRIIYLHEESKGNYSIMTQLVDFAKN